MLAASQIAFLPVDLGRWDRCPGGDALVVPLWTDVRPLRGAAGLLDWRLNGRLSQLLREGRVEGATGEKLLFVTSRVPWRRVLTVGVGPTTSFSEDAFRASLGLLVGGCGSAVGRRRAGRCIGLGFFVTGAQSGKRGDHQHVLLEIRRHGCPHNTLPAGALS